jgi:hypothetical protein
MGFLTRRGLANNAKSFLGSRLGIGTPNTRFLWACLEIRGRNTAVDHSAGVPYVMTEIRVKEFEGIFDPNLSLDLWPFEFSCDP